MKTEMKTESIIRPCFVRGFNKVLERGLFHRFCDMYNGPEVIVGAVVELEDGALREVYASSIRFLDSEEMFAKFFDGRFWEKEGISNE